MGSQEQMRRLESRLAELDEKIRGLEVRLERADSKLRDTYSHEVADLRNKRHAAEQRLAQLRLRDAESWEEDDLARGLFEIFDEIGERLDRLFSKTDAP